MLDPQDIRVTSYLPSSGHGAGGQMVGLTTSGVIVHHMPSGLGVSCDSERSQYRNKEKALELLEQLVHPATQPQGHCERTWDGGCVCGGDLPAIREGCYNWKK